MRPGDGVSKKNFKIFQFLQGCCKGRCAILGSSKGENPKQITITKEINTMKRNQIFTRTLATGLAATMMISMTVTGFAAETNEGRMYNGFEIKDISYICDGGQNIEFKYSDGLFLDNQFEYNPHLATASDAMAEASTTHVENGDWSHGSATIEEVLTKCGFENIEASSTYSVQPTADSIAYIFGSKYIETEDGERTIISVTVRSANYDSEWASNVTLDTKGEATGFEKSADTVYEALRDYMGDHSRICYNANHGKRRRGGKPYRKENS